MVFKDDDQFDPGVLFQSKIPFPIGKKDFLYLFVFHQGEELIMDGTFDNHFMNPYSIHHPEEPLLLSLYTSFGGKGGIFVWNDPYPPSLTIWLAAGPIGQRLMRSEMLITGTERAVFFIGRLFDQRLGLYKIMGSP
jgi:hypothetical protein